MLSYLIIIFAMLFFTIYDCLTMRDRIEQLEQAISIIARNQKEASSLILELTRITKKKGK